ncbi:hypothetical protein [uncultured Shewanella sp.]|uniref:hypothetical protein n=1 Tax=uncultured Shewanella sp. TaxID=173975 RepID=UPI002601D294|nr:hypothetical protein [uncultured Shewanella sp.]
MTLISPSKTSYLHNVEIPHNKESINQFDSLFSEEYISKEQCHHLGLNTRLNELKHFAKQGEYPCIDLLLTLTSRRDAIGHFATQALLEIKEDTQKGSHEADIFNLHCESFYQQCRLNEINHRSPQLCQLPTDMLKVLIDIMLTSGNASNQDIFNLIQVLQKQSNLTSEQTLETSPLASTPVSMTEEKGFIVISNTESQSLDDLTNNTLKENGNHIMDNTHMNKEDSKLNPYQPLNNDNQASTAHLTPHFQNIDPLSQTRHEFIDFLQTIRKTTYFSDSVMEKLIHKWDVNNPIFIPKPDIESTYSSAISITSQQWQSRLSSAHLHDPSLINTASTSNDPFSENAMVITHDEIKMDTEISSNTQTETRSLSEKLSTWFASFLKNNT